MQSDVARLRWLAIELPKRGIYLLPGVRRFKEFQHLVTEYCWGKGVIRDELKAIMVQIAVYAGIPAGVECFRIANRVPAELDSG